MRRLFSTLLFALLALDSAPAFALTPQKNLVLLSGGFDADAQAYFGQLAVNGCVAPTVSFKKAVARYITAEKAAGNWNQDAEYIFATNSSCTASINLAQPTLYKLTWSGSCTWTILAGLNGDGATCVGDIGVNQSALVRWMQNNGHFDVWANSTNKANAFGTLTGVLNKLSLVTNKATALNSATTITDTGGGTAGLHFADRTASTSINTGLNGVLQTTAGSATSVALTAAHVTICQTAASFCPAAINELFVGFGGAMNNEATHYTNVRNLLVALGVDGI